MNILKTIVKQTQEDKKRVWRRFTKEEKFTEERKICPIPKDIFLFIAEMKKSSPSLGKIASNYDPLSIAEAYYQCGAPIFSILTEERYFGGSVEHLKTVKDRYSNTPLLRKDFIVHPYQIWETRQWGGDIVLLMASILDASLLQELHSYAIELGLSVLLEIHNEEELNQVLKLSLTPPPLLGINNRDLKTLKVDIETCFRLIGSVPPSYRVIAESGFKTPEEIRRLRQKGFSGSLVGHSLLLEGKSRSLLKKMVEASREN